MGERDYVPIPAARQRRPPRRRGAARAGGDVAQRDAAGRRESRLREGRRSCAIASSKLESGGRKRGAAQSEPARSTRAPRARARQDRRAESRPLSAETSSAPNGSSLPDVFRQLLRRANPRQPTMCRLALACRALHPRRDVVCARRQLGCAGAEPRARPRSSSSFVPTDRAQIAVWVERGDGKFMGTLCAHPCGRGRGIGNRPGAAADEQRLSLALRAARGCAAGLGAPPRRARPAPSVQARDLPGSHLRGLRVAHQRRPERRRLLLPVVRDRGRPAATRSMP